MSLSSNISEKAALIWAIADKLTGVYKPHEYGEVILPLTVFRRFDCILADTKEAVSKNIMRLKICLSMMFFFVKQLAENFIIQVNIPLKSCLMTLITSRQTSVIILMDFQQMCVT